MRIDSEPTAEELIELDARAVRASMELVETATPADMSRPTPCSEWTLDGLLTHMAAQHYGFAASARGETSLSAWKLEDLGDDPTGAYRKAAEHQIDAFAADGVPDGEFVLPEFSTEKGIPAVQAIGFHLVDYVVHAWDVAKTLGTTVEFDPDVLNAALRIAQAVPTGDEVRATPGAAFAPVVVWEGDGSQLDEIVALLGRSPTWPQ